jgi:hypothetical protein
MVAALLILGACTSAPQRGGDGRTSAEPTVSPPRGEVTSSRALRSLCSYPEIPRDKSSRGAAPAPAIVEEVESQVAALRGLAFRDPVRVEVVSADALAEGLRRLNEDTIPEDLYRRRSLAWQTIGVIHRGTDISDVFRTFGPVDVLGYYLPGQGLLRIIGEGGDSAFERFVLAHELTHALDDQHFDLERFERERRACHDDAALASTAIIEGNATVMMFRWAAAVLSTNQVPAPETILPKGAVPVEGHPPLFMGSLGGFPYVDGATFMAALWQRGGQEAVDRVFEDPPVSTEQILHPDAYPDDVPQHVDVPDLAPALGEGWSDLDVQDVGEEWLRALMQLKEERQTVEIATEGWDGGRYRAWSNGDEVAVVMTTAWDSHQDAVEFAIRMEDWIDPRRHAEVLPTDGDRSSVLFASDAATLRLLEAAVG